MSHGGGGGGGGYGHSGGGHHHHHGGHHMGGGEPDQSVSWNMAYVGDKRTGSSAKFNPLPIYIGLIVFSVMILPFVMDWNEPHLQRLLIGHDLTEKEIEHNNAIDQALAGAMRSHANKAFGSEIGGLMIPDPAPVSGSSLIGQQPSPSSIPDNNQSRPAGGLSNFSISADSPPQTAPSGLSASMAPAPSYYPDVRAGAMPAQVAPTVGFSNQRFISQPPSPAYVVPGSGSGLSSGGIDYHAKRHRVVVDR